MTATVLRMAVHRTIPSDDYYIGQAALNVRPAGWWRGYFRFYAGRSKWNDTMFPWPQVRAEYRRLKARDGYRATVEAIR